MADKQALEAAKKQQQDFLASIAHELRTPLNGIIGLSDALFKSEQNKGRAKHLKMIFSCANRLVGLVNMIMDITALRDGKLNLTVNDAVSVNEICEEVQELMINAVDKNGKKIKKDSVDLQIDLDSSAPSIQGDRERLTQVVYNLVNNALKFTEGGFVKMSTKFDQGTLLFCCSDSGKGIKKENFKKIFEAFGQEEEGKGGGLGLGLAIVTKILDLHGGKIWVESELGKGAQFWVRLPLKMDPNALAAIKAEADAKAAVEEAAVSSTAAPAAGGGAGHSTHGESDDNKTLIDDARARLTSIPSKIMIIDHDNDRLEKTKKIVSSHPECPNPVIVSASDGVKGLSQIDNTNLPDLIIVDSDIPGQLSAFDVINTLRAEQSPDLNIVAICADATKQMMAIKSLATSTLIRPWSSDEFFSSFFYETLLAQTMIKLDRENKIGIEMMGRLLPHSIAQKMTKQTNAIMSESYKGITVLTIMIREFDQIVALIPISQVSVLLNRIQAAIDSCLSQFDVVRLDSAAASSAGEFVIVCGHDRQEDHIDKVMGYGKRILTLIGNGNLKIAGHAVEFLVGVDSSTGVGCVVSGISSSSVGGDAASPAAAGPGNNKSSSPRYLVFGQAIELSRRLCITGVANHVHVSKSVADKINEEYEGSGLYDFVERGVLGDGELGVPTFVLKLNADENGEGFKSTSLNSTLSQFFEGSPGQLGTCSGSSNIKDQMEEYEAKMKLLELRLGIMRGVDGSEAIKAIETKILKTGAIPATALLAITDPIEQVLNSIERIVGGHVSATDVAAAAASPPPLVDDIKKLEKETEDLSDEIESIQKTAREARKQVHQAIATAAIGSSKSSSIGVSKQGAESMGIVLDDMIEMIEEIDSKLNVSGFLPASASNGELHKILSDLTIEVESVSSSIDKTIRFYTEMGAGGGSLADLNALKQMSEQVHQLKLEIAKKDQVLAGMPINGGIPKEEAMSMLQELMGFQQECRTLHLEIEWYQEKIAELSGTNSKLLEDNRTLANDIREAKNILDEQERTIRHQQLQLTQASSMSEFHQPAIPGYFRPYGQSGRGHSLPPGGRLSSIRTPGPQAGAGLYHWAQMSGFNFNPSLAQMSGTPL